VPPVQDQREDGYKWLARSDAGDATLGGLSRRSHTCPKRTEPDTEWHILAVREAHPVWRAQDRGLSGAGRRRSTGDPDGA
jgi:hypothetical protein